MKLKDYCEGLKIAKFLSRLNPSFVHQIHNQILDRDLVPFLSATFLEFYVSSLKLHEPPPLHIRWRTCPWLLVAMVEAKVEDVVEI